MRKNLPKTSDKTHLKEELSSLKMRVYPTRKQEQQFNLWFYQIQHFRNEMVAFCNQRRLERFQWKQKNPDAELPEALKKNDIQAASLYLTKELQAARKTLNCFHLISGWSGKGQGLEFIRNTLSQWGKLSASEKEELHHAYWLLFPRTLLDQVLRDMDKTYSKAFKDLKGKSSKKAGFPQFRKTSYRYSVRFQLTPSRQKAYCEHWEAGMIFIPALGSVLKFRDKRGLPKTIPEMLTVSRNAAGHYHVSFLNKDKPVSQLKEHKSFLLMKLEFNGKTYWIPKIESMDWSLAKHGVLTDGKALKRERYLKREANRLKQLQQGLSRKKKGSSRWKKSRKAIGKLHTHVANQREEGLRELAREIMASLAILCLEDLFIKGMMANHKLAKSIADAAPSRFKQLLKWEAQKQGKLVLECGRWDASSKTCSYCGHKYEELVLEEREWTCAECHTFHDRDVNAANNIRWMALQRHLTPTIQASSGNDEVKLSSYQLIPELESFIAHGGLGLCLLSFIPLGLKDKTVFSNTGKGKFDPGKILAEVRVSEISSLKAGAEER